MKPYFVILNHPTPGLYMPLVDEEEEMLFFESEGDAVLAAEGTHIGSQCGYEVFELGCGL